jgi:hypothetical protein
MNEKDPHDELPELEELEPLPDDVEALPELPSEAAALEELPVEALPVAAQPGASAPAAGDASQKRELDRAPILLRKAALIVAAGSLLPWAAAEEIPITITWAGSLLAKAVMLLAIWILYQAHVATHGGPVAAPLGGLGKVELKLGKKGKLNLLTVVALVVAIAALLPIEGAFAVEGAFSFASLSEKMILLLAGYTFAHIYDYEHGGKFNPLAPLMFIAPAIGGLGALFKVFPINPLAGVGALAVAGGGILACVTLGMAMRQAKIEGDAKRTAALEARKAARAASGGGKPGPRGPARAPTRSPGRPA